jgi:rod shape-determining protein MreC
MPSLNVRLLIAIILSLGLIITDHRTKNLDQVRTVLSILAYPLIYSASAIWFTDILSFHANLVELESDNRRLHQENLLLQARLQQLDALEAENMRLRDLLGSSFKIGERVLIAELISVDMAPYRQQVMINKGSSSGVFVGQPVLDAHAVVGQVIRTTPSTATVLLITDAAHALPVQINRNGLRTIAEGTGLIDNLRLPYVANNADAHEGDLLITSGLGGHFPPGYPVAKIYEVKHEPGKPFAKVIATPNANLQRIREVLLVWPLISEQATEDFEIETATFPE